jgi:hypothetical protein
MFPQLARFTNLGLLLLRLMVGLVFITSGYSHLKDPEARSKSIEMSKGCSELCTACAAECGKYEGETMRKCAQACRQCAATCAEVAQAGPIRRAAA